MENNGQVLIRGGTLVTPHEMMPETNLVIDGERIDSIGVQTDPEAFDVVIDAKGHYVCPGLIDMHIQGVLGHDVWEEQQDGVRGMAEALPRFGCTGFVAVSNYDESYANLLAKRVASRPEGGAEVLGLYFEGPFVSNVRGGSLPDQTELSVTRDSIERILELSEGQLCAMAVAPELPGVLDVVKILAANSILPSLGHSDASYEQVLEAVKLGLRNATHCFNAMRPMMHRDPGALGAALLTDEVSIEVIADNHHLHPAMYDLVSKVKPWEKIVLITDAVRAAGMPPGRYLSKGHGREITLKDGAVRADTGKLSGSAATIDVVLRNFRERIGCSVPRAVQLVTYNPACVLGLQNEIGQIKRGCRGNVVLLDDDLQVQQTIVRGRVVFDPSGS